MKIIFSMYLLLPTIFFLLIGYVFSQGDPVPTLPTLPPKPVESQNKPVLPNLNANNDAGSDADGNACDPKKDIMLNISIPFIGRCIKKSSSVDQANENPNNSTIGNVFPKLMGGLIRITMTAVYIIGFLGILLGGFMIASNGALGTKETGKKLIIGVVAGMILLGISGIILNLINPEFFGTES